MVGKSRRYTESMAEKFVIDIIKRKGYVFVGDLRKLGVTDGRTAHKVLERFREKTKLIKRINLKWGKRKLSFWILNKTKVL